MYEAIMVRYGDLTLKGRNQKIFKRTLNQQIRNKLSTLDVNVEFQHDLIYIHLNQCDPDRVIALLDTIAGLSSYSKVAKTIYDFDEITQTAVDMINIETKGQTTTFKVETKRADKTIPLTSQEISIQLSKMILRRVSNLKVDVHNPEMTLNIEVRKDATYLYMEKIKGMGGFPVSMGGKAMVLLSGGIDSPVSAYLAMRKGLVVECVHFESTPMTSIESAQKVIDLCERLAHYAPDCKLKLHMVPFKDLHEQIMLHIEEPYIITVMRRMMYRIATALAKKHDCQVLVSGDSVGQVASQTLESITTVQNATDMVVLRPLATDDKMEIVKLATKIKTLDISNRPFSDCCTIYVPRNPVIKPTIAKAKACETAFDYKAFVKDAVKRTKCITVDTNQHIDIQAKGLIVQEVLE